MNIVWNILSAAERQKQDADVQPQDWRQLKICTFTHLNGEDVPRKRVLSDLAKKIFTKFVPKVWPRKREINTHTQCGQEHFLTTETCMTWYFMKERVLLLTRTDKCNMNW